MGMLIQFGAGFLMGILAILFLYLLGSFVVLFFYLLKSLYSVLHKKYCK